jgi:dTDP-glucose pyrophosphorylase/CBS domain-containing protein
MTWPQAEHRLPVASVDGATSIRAAVRRLDQAGTGALLVLDDESFLRGVLTDGDIRRAILKGVSFDTPVAGIATSTPLVASDAVTRQEALHLMDHGRDYQVNQLPLVSAEGRALGLLLRRDIVTDDELDLSALIMAGGFGTRMLPLTEQVPKPMLPVQDRPLLEWTLTRLRNAGIQDVVISTHHLADRISSHFGDGAEYGVAVRYVHEFIPLGTAGALRLIDDVHRPMLVVNGDILSGVPFGDMLAFHRQQGTGLTVGVRRCELQLPYGVLELDGAQVRSVHEKPAQSYWVNAGIYIVEPSVRRRIPPRRRYDMTDLIADLLAAGSPVAGFPIVEYWIDVGQPADYIRAHADTAALEAVS